MNKIEIKLHKTFILGIVGMFLFELAIFEFSYTFFVINKLYNAVSISVEIFFILMFSLSLMLFLYSKKATITPEYFSVSNYFGTYLINWQDIKYIEYGAGNMIAGNALMRFALPSVEYWDKHSRNYFIQTVLPFIKKMIFL